jgi:hypothetical protein
MSHITLSLVTENDIVTFTWDQDSVLISRTHSRLPRPDDTEPPLTVGSDVPPNDG